MDAAAMTKVIMHYVWNQRHYWVVSMPLFQLSSLQIHCSP